MLQITRLTDASTEPVTIDALRTWCSVDDPVHEPLLLDLARAARHHLEDTLGYVCLTSTWQVLVDAPSVLPWRLPLRPIQAVTRVAWADTDGVWTDFSPGGSPTGTGADYLVDPVARTFTRVTDFWPATMRTTDSLLFEVTAGHLSAALVPPSLLLAIQMLVAHWHEGRTPVSTVAGTPVPYHIQALVQRFRPSGVLRV